MTLQSVLDGLSSSADFPPTSDAVNVAQILKTIFVKLNDISKSNLKLHDKINDIDASTSSDLPSTS